MFVLSERLFLLTYISFLASNPISPSSLSGRQVLPLLLRKQGAGSHGLEDADADINRHQIIRKGRRPRECFCPADPAGATLTRSHGLTSGPSCLDSTARNKESGTDGQIRIAYERSCPRVNESNERETHNISRKRPSKKEGENEDLRVVSFP